MEMSSNPESIIFIDADGVWRWLSGPVALAQQGSITDGINTHAIDLLNRLAEETESCFVISSSWRTTGSSEEVIDEHVKHGFKKELFHPTDSCTGPVLRKRANEIVEWLARHVEVKNYVAVDDERPKIPKAVKIDGNLGFNIYNYNHCCRLLGQPEKQLQLKYYSPQTVRRKARLAAAKPS